MTGLPDLVLPAPAPVDQTTGVPEPMKPSEALTLKEAFENMVCVDPRCAGLAGYIANVRIFWSRSIPTACAGHGFIFFNPDFYDRLPEETRISVMVHEVWHLILKHLDRGKGCDPYTHNVAADHVINNGMGVDGFTFEGADPHMDPQYLGQSTEQVYAAIYAAKDPDAPPDLEEMAKHVSAEQIEDMIEEIVNAEGKTLDQQKSDAEEDVDKHAAACGNQTGNNGIRLDLTDNIVMIKGATYHEIFEPYLTDPLSGGKRTFMRPNRRQHGMKGKLLLPGRFPKRGHLNRLKHLVYAFDVSGSMMAHVQQCHDSIRTLKDTLNPSKMTVIFFDTKIVHEQTFTDKEQYGNIHVRAGGGTNLSEVYARAAELDPEALVIFTDLCVPIPPKPKWESIWLATSASDNIPANIHGTVYLIPPTN
jgi:predicted metal-dependent peptidase